MLTLAFHRHSHHCILSTWLHSFSVAFHLKASELHSCIPILWLSSCNPSLEQNPPHWLLYCIPSHVLLSCILWMLRRLAFHCYSSPWVPFTWLCLHAFFFAPFCYSIQSMQPIRILYLPLFISPFLYFERSLDSNPESCRSKQTLYQLSHPPPFWTLIECK